MKNVLIVHGCTNKEEFLSGTYPSLSNSHWLPWIQKQLGIKDIECQTPEMPRPYAPSYDDWKRVLKQFQIDQDTVLVGHSCGAGFLLRWLSENNQQIAKLILVAPYFNPGKREMEADGLTQFTLDQNLTKRLEIHVFYSKDDDVEGVTEAVKTLQKKLPDAHYHFFEDKGHFISGDMQTDEFPELLDLILKK